MRVEIMTWEKAQPLAAPIRFAIFFETDAPGIELDATDPQCAHAVAYDENGKPVGTARLQPDGHIGHLAVLREWRRLGVGAALVEALVAEALARGFKSVSLTAPLQAAEFYRERGFAGEGKVFKEGAALSQKMRKDL